MEKVVLTPVSNLTPSEQTEAHNIAVEANSNHLMGIKEPNVINDEPNVIREEVRKSQRKQAEKMLERSKSICIL